MHHLRSAKLSKWQIRSLCISGSVLFLSGVCWLLLHNFGQVQGDFGPQASPWEPWMLRLHGAAVIAALMSLGTLTLVHIWRGWLYRRQRTSGLSLSVGMGLLIISGYLLYYVSDDGVRGWTSTIHWVIGVVALPLFIVHHRSGKRLRNSDD
jgi:hypothetical protein